MPDANTIWTFREALTRAKIAGRPAIGLLFSAYDTAPRDAGFLAIGGQIVDTSEVAAPKQRNTEAEKADLKAGRVPDAPKAKLAKLARDETATRAGRSSGRRPSQLKMGRSGSTSRCRLSATRSKSASIPATG